MRWWQVCVSLHCPFQRSGLIVHHGGEHSQDPFTLGYYRLRKSPCTDIEEVKMNLSQVRWKSFYFLSHHWTGSVSINVIIHPSCLNGSCSAAGLVDVVGDKASSVAGNVLIVCWTKCSADFRAHVFQLGPIPAGSILWGCTTVVFQATGGHPLTRQSVDVILFFSPEKI